MGEWEDWLTSDECKDFDRSAAIQYLAYWAIEIPMQREDQWATGFIPSEMISDGIFTESECISAGWIKNGPDYWRPDLNRTPMTFAWWSAHHPAFIS